MGPQHSVAAIHTHRHARTRTHTRTVPKVIEEYLEWHFWPEGLQEQNG